MSKLRAFLAVVVAGGLVVAAVPGVSQAAARLTEVLVVNEDTDPVPAKILGTTLVSGTVGVSGGSITVANGDADAVPTRSVGTDNVKVTNDAADAIPVTVTNQPAGAASRLPYQATLQLQFGGQDGPVQFANALDSGIPDDKLL